MRPFNHIGPGQGEQFVTAAFARQVAAIEAGLQEPVLRVGNLSAERDFTDVRDMVRAYYLAITQGEPGAVYNIGSGRGTADFHILDTLLSMSKVDVRVEQIRPAAAGGCAAYRLRPPALPGADGGGSGGRLTAYRNGRLWRRLFYRAIVAAAPHIGAL